MWFTTILGAYWKLINLQWGQLSGSSSFTTVLEAPPPSFILFSSLSRGAGTEWSLCKGVMLMNHSYAEGTEVLGQSSASSWGYYFPSTSNLYGWLPYSSSTTVVNGPQIAPLFQNSSNARWTKEPLWVSETIGLITCVTFKSLSPLQISGEIYWNQFFILSQMEAPAQKKEMKEQMSEWEREWMRERVKE